MNFFLSEVSPLTVPRVITSMTANQYASYLESDLWQTNRAYLRSFPYYRRYAVCERGEVELHHTSYSYLGPLFYPPKFIVQLCGSHHQALHDLIKADGLNLAPATERLLILANRSAVPVEYKRHAEAVNRTAKHLTALGQTYGLTTNSPANVVGVTSAGQPYLLRVTTHLSNFDFEFLKQARCPEKVRRAIVVWNESTKEPCVFPI